MNFVPQNDKQTVGLLLNKFGITMEEFEGPAELKGTHCNGCSCPRPQVERINIFSDYNKVTFLFDTNGNFLTWDVQGHIPEVEDDDEVDEVNEVDEWGEEW